MARCYLPLALCLLLIQLFRLTAPAVSNELPEKFLGTWSVDHSDDDFDAYLEAKGYNFFERQLAKLASLSKTFKKNGDGTYTETMESTSKDVEWPNFRLGEQFQGEYLDDTQHKILITYSPSEDALIENHQEVDTDKREVFKYTVSAEGWLVMQMEYNGVKTKRYYTKE